MYGFTKEKKNACMAYITLRNVHTPNYHHIVNAHPLQTTNCVNIPVKLPQKY
jgi:hypothetical protein